MYNKSHQERVRSEWKEQDPAGFAAQEARREADENAKKARRQPRGPWPKAKAPGRQVGDGPGATRSAGLPLLPLVEHDVSVLQRKAEGSGCVAQGTGSEPGRQVGSKECRDGRSSEEPGRHVGSEECRDGPGARRFQGPAETGISTDPGSAETGISADPRPSGPAAARRVYALRTAPSATGETTSVATLADGLITRTCHVVRGNLQRTLARKS